MPSNRILSRIVLATLAVAPVATVVAFFRHAAANHPVLLITLLVAWEGLLFIGRFFGRVYGKLQERWVDRAAEWSDTTLRRVFSRYPREYKYFLSRMHHDVDLRGLSTWGMHTLAMDEVFVDLSLRPQLPSRIPSGPIAEDDDPGHVLRPEGPKEIHHSVSLAGNEESPVDTTRRSIWETLDQYPDGPLAVLGPPGSGKTTLLRHVTLVLCRPHRGRQVPKKWRSHVPVLIFLREHITVILADPNTPLPDVVRRTLSRLTKSEPPGWLDRQLDRGRCVVMLDGLDEVAKREDRAVVMKWVRNQIEQYPRNQFILTSRPFGFVDPPLISATVMQVRQFTDTQVGTFVKGWYRTVEQRSANRDDVGVRARAEEGAEKLLDRLYASPALLALAVNPLLLTMITSVHKYRAALPGSRAELYREICQVFLGKRQEAKELTSDLSIDQKTIVLRHLAYAMMEQRIRDISTEKAAEVIAPILEKVSYSGSPRQFLIEIEQTSGLLIERDNEVYAFTHLTFQEYLAALHVAEVKPIEFLVARLDDPWWREVTLLRVATADATPIVEAALRQPPTLEMLSLASDCIDQAREVTASAKKQLADKLSWRAGEHDAARLEIAAKVVLGRKLQQVIRSKSGSFICSEPVSNAEYAFFLQHPDTDTVAYSPPSWTMEGTDKEELPVVGITPQAANLFVEWGRALGLDVRIPWSSVFTADDLRRLERPPAIRFWARTQSEEYSSHGGKDTSAYLRTVGLTARRGLESVSATRLVEQMELDAGLLLTFIAPESRSDVGIVTDDQHVSIELDTLTSLLSRWNDPNIKDRNPFSDPASQRESRERAKEFARHLISISSHHIDITSPVDIQKNSVPESYVARVPRVLKWFDPAWNGELHFGVTHLTLKDAGSRRIAFRGVDPTFMDELDSLSLGMSSESQLIRAYMRMVMWAEDILESEEDSSSMSKRARWTWRRAPRSYSWSDLIDLELASLFLREWYSRDLFPLTEGLLLVRE